MNKSTEINSVIKCLIKSGWYMTMWFHAKVLCQRTLIFHRLDVKNWKENINLKHSYMDIS